MRRSATFTARLLLLLLSPTMIAACGGENPVEAKTSDFRPTYAAGKSRSKPVPPGAVFTDVTRAAGIDFVHVNGATDRKYLPETMGSGVVLFDYDNDGRLDILFVQSRRWEGEEQPTMRLFRNEGGWKFTDVTKGSGLEVACFGMGASAADYDADGDMDLYVTCVERDLMFRNEGGRFERVAGGPDGGTWTDEKGVVRPSWSTGCAWLDADGDGDLDLVVVPYVRWTPERDIYAQAVEGTKAYVRPQLYEGDAPRLYLQQPDGTFVDGTKGSGLADTRVPGKSMAVLYDDFDADGRLDLFISNDTVQNFLFLGRGGGRFEEAAVPAAIAYDDQGRARAAMGVDTVDWRNDGRLGIAIGNFSEEPVSLYSVVAGRAGSVLFEDDARAARIGHVTLLPLTFGLLMVDADLDGWCDMFLANGHIEPSITRLKKELQYEQSPQFLKNLGGRRFADVTREAGPGLQTRMVGRGLAAGDLDGDGDLDLVFTSNGGRAAVLRCDQRSGHKSLRLRLRQPGTKNLDALGAAARVTAGGVTQRRLVRTGGSYLSQSELVLTFGIGTAARAEKVEVIWPDGTRQDVGPLEAGTHVVERER